MSLRKVIPSALFVTALVATALAGLSWACTPQPAVTVTGSSGAAGDILRVRGGGFEASPVELRWNELDGPVLAVAAGPEFQADVQLPSDAAPGFYYIVAVQKGQDGRLAGRAAETIEVVNSVAQSRAGALETSLWSGFSSAENLPDAAQAQGAAPSPAPISRAGVALALLASAGIFATVLLTSRRRIRGALSQRSKTG